jgi:hypothetical protein
LSKRAKARRLQVALASLNETSQNKIRPKGQKYYYENCIQIKRNSPPMGAPISTTGKML